MTTVVASKNRAPSNFRLDILAIAALLSIVTLSVGGWFTSLGMGKWYQELNVPPWQPPGWVFGPAWVVLMTLVAVSAWLVFRDSTRSTMPASKVKLAKVFYVVQLILNATWSLLFFALQSPQAALVEIILLDVVVISMAIAFYGVSRTAGWLQLPYVLWLFFATAINAWIVSNN